MDGLKFFVQENGIAILTDPRMKHGETIEITFGVWVVNPESYNDFAATIVSKGLFVRDMNKREAKRLNRKASEFMDRAVKTLAKSTRKKNE